MWRWQEKTKGGIMGYLNQNRLERVKRWVKSNKLKFNRDKFTIQKTNLSTEY